MDKPKIVCLCGSTWFVEAFRETQFKETMAGNIVLTIGCNMRTDEDLFSKMSDAEKHISKKHLDELHLRKIDLADEVIVLNIDGYIGFSTGNEIEYARSLGKPVRYLEGDNQNDSL